MAKRHEIHNKAGSGGSYIQKQQVKRHNENYELKKRLHAEQEERKRLLAEEIAERKADAQRKPKHKLVLANARVPSLY